MRGGARGRRGRRAAGDHVLGGARARRSTSRRRTPSSTTRSSRGATARGPTASTELRGKKVIVFRGGIMDETLTRARPRRRSRPRRTRPPTRCGSSPRAQHDAVALATLPGVHLVRELGLTNVAPVGEADRRRALRLRGAEGQRRAPRRGFDEGLAILKKTGRYDAIHDALARRARAARRSTVARPLRAAAASSSCRCSSCSAGPCVWSRSLQREVAQRTASLAREVEERERARGGAAPAPAAARAGRQDGGARRARRRASPTR